MTTIQITRHYIAANVEAAFTVGNHEADGHAEMTEYLIPAGYSLQDDRIYNDLGWECAVCADDEGRPTLISRGPGADHVLVEA